MAMRNRRAQLIDLKGPGDKFSVSLTIGADEGEKVRLLHGSMDQGGGLLV
jgi:hypothetical protein